MKIRSIVDVSTEKPTFDDVKEWHAEHLSTNVIDFDDPKPYGVYEEGKFAGIFQCTSRGAQKLFMKAKPKNIIDIATLTSVYRPGPLAAGVDKLYIDAQSGKEYDWGDLRINEILKDTRGCIVFQEQVMLIAEKCAGFAKGECDEVRRAIMKRSISTGADLKKKADDLREKFVKGCIANEYTEQVSNKLYDALLYYAGYGFNKSHAVAYAIDSFYCAWLMTYYESAWLTAYVESMLNNPKAKARAFGELRHLGYNIVPLDVNEAGEGWRVLSGKKFMPSLYTCKGIGASAIDELIALRPFKTIEELLWNDDGSWRLSKFNRRALEALIKVRAFGSLDCVGDGEEHIFASYRHMHEVVIENNDAIKKSSRKDPHQGRKTFYELARALRADCSDEWSRKELAQNQVEVLGSFDVWTLFEPEVMQKLNEKDVKPIDELESGDEEIVWLCVQDCTLKKTKNGKSYVQLTVIGGEGSPKRLNVWGSSSVASFEPFGLYVADTKSDDFGYSTTSWKLKRVR
jgi:DNA polymerase III alpha subunit